MGSSKISCAILKLLYSLCLNNDSDTIHFLIRENGINILKHLFEKVGKHGKFTIEFTYALFKILELPNQDNTRLSQVLALLLERIVFNIRIWSNSDYAVQKTLTERAHELLSREATLPFNAGQPYKVVLCMLFDYFASEEADDSKVKKFLNETRWELMEVLIDYFQGHGSEETVPTLLEFLLPLPDYFYSIRDLLYVILIYQSKANKNYNQVIANYLKTVARTHRKEFDLAAALHILISNAITQKGRGSIEDPVAAKKRSECCEHIISYCIYILLLFDWEEIFEKEESILMNLISSAQSNKKPTRKSIAMTNVNTVFSKGGSFLAHLNPARKRGRFARKEEILLHFLFHNPKAESGREAYNKGFLGERTYIALLAHLHADPSVFYEKEKEIQKKLVDMDRNGWNTVKNRIIYGKLIGNIKSFELPVQKKILSDCKEFLGNRGFLKMFVGLTTIYEAICGYLSNQKFLADLSMKSSLETFYLFFLLNYWQGSSKRIFNDMWYMPNAELLLILNTFLNRILSQFPLLLNDKCRYSAIQLAYFLEDIALSTPSVLGQSLFVDVLGKLILYLNELRVLYFWHPLFTPGQLPRNLPLEPRAGEYEQREGGVVRVVLKLLLKVILEAEKSDMDFLHKQLALNLLDLFVFHKDNTLIATKMLLGITFEKSSSENEDFFSSSVNSAGKMSIIMQDKVLGQQKSVEELKKIMGSKKNVLEAKFYRGMILYTNISQVLLYIGYGLDSYNNSKKAEMNIDYRVTHLAKMLGEIVKLCYVLQGTAFDELFKDLEKTFIRMPEYPLEKCISNIDKCSRDFIESMRPFVEFAPSTSSKIYPAPIAGSSKERAESEYVPLFDKFKKDLFKLLADVVQLFDKHKSKELTQEAYAEQILLTIGKNSILKSTQPELHRLTTEDFLHIEKLVLTMVENKPRERAVRSQAKLQCNEDKERVLRMHALVKDFNAVFNKQLINLNPDSERVKNDKEYEDLRKRILSEFFFSVQNRENAKIYEISKKYYTRLLNRCILHKSMASLHPENPLGFNSFVKLDKTRDNLNRAMRLKEIKHPLDNPSVLKGIAYIRQFFLKRCLLAHNVDTGFKSFLRDRSFYICDVYEHKVLKALVEYCKPPVSSCSSGLADVLGEESEKETLHRSTGGFAIKACVSRTQLAIECKVKTEVRKITYHAEMVEVDHSTFGHLRLSNNEITFTSKPKPAHSEYRLGPTKMMLLPRCRKVKKVWRYSDIDVIMAQKYNMVRQAMEVRFASRKTVFIVLFSEERLNSFFKDLQDVTAGLFPEPIKVVRDCRKEFADRKYTDEWLKLRLSNFEYLMLLNEHSSRSFQCMSQYPVFPWILRDYFSERILLSSVELRDLQYPIAGLTDKKRELARSKYENTGDFPGGRFQYGSHYLSGRAVLGYLIRLQPYTLMLYRFDSGGDCPTRCFHRLETMWSNITTASGNNLELIPEFYYLPDFLAN